MPSITKFLLVSALSIRRRKAPWWTDEEWAQVQKVNTEIMPAYYKAKLEADECLTVLGERRAGFPYMILRPGMLTDGPATGKVQLGYTKGRGEVSRADVADVAARLLETNCRGWFDLLAGDENVESAVERVAQSGVNSVEGEDLQEMEGNL
jgi:nucleoside-diphosphate-sugar epimerase